MNKIIVIEDNDDLRIIISETLQSEGYKTLSYSQGSKLIPIVKEFEPNIVLLDVNLPGENGDVLAKKLQRSVDVSAVKIVLMSSLHKLPEIAKEINADGYLQKPFGLDELITYLEQI